MKIAFATKDMEHINDHFGRAQNMALYEIDETGYKHIETISFKGEMDEEDDRLNPKISALASCSIVYSCAIGPMGATRLVKQRIHPMKATEDTKIKDVLDKLQATLASNPAPWLKKIIHNLKEEKETVRGEE